MQLLTRRAVLAAAVATGAVVSVPVVATLSSAPAGTTLQLPSSSAPDASSQAGTSTSPKAGKAVGKLERKLNAVVRRMVVREVASLTGETPQAIRQQLARGQTLAQIAGSQASAAKSAVMEKITTRVDALVSKGKLTQSQADAILKRASADIDRLMNKVFHPGTKNGGTTAAPGTTAGGDALGSPTDFSTT